MPSPETQLTQPVVTLGMIWPARCASGTRQIEVVPKFVPLRWIAAIEHKIS